MQSLLFELTALLSFWLCLNAWQRDRSARGRRLFIALTGTVCAWSTAWLGHLHGALGHDAIHRIAYLGILPLPVIWLALALVVRGARIVERAPWALWLLLAPGAVCYALLFQEGEAAALFLSAGNGPAARLTPGPLFYANAGYGWLLASLGSYHVVMSARSLRSRRERVARVVAGLLTLSPMLGNAAYLAMGMPGLDPTPILVAACLVAFRSVLFSGNLLQALPLSQHDLLSQLPEPLILTDGSGRVIEINPAAEACLAVVKADALDRNVEGLLEQSDIAPEFERWSLVADGAEVGSILLPMRPKGAGEGGAA